MIDFSSPVLWILIIALMVILIGVPLAARTIRAGELPPMDKNQLMWNVENLMRSRRWNTQAVYSKGKITVSKDPFVAANIYFKKLPSGKIEVRTGVNAGTWGWVMVVLFMAAFGGIVLALILHFMSRGFAKKEVIPRIFDHHKTYGLNRKMAAYQVPNTSYSLLPRSLF
jgi:hypothetical protein